MPNEDQLRNILRVVALATTDSASREICLDALEETSSDARAELALTCWGEDLNRLREALNDYLEHSSYAVAKRRWNANADEFNQWGELGHDEKDELVTEERNLRR